MMSNTATPKYYGEWRDAVIRGEIPVCETIAMEMNRIDALIRNPNIYYDPTKVEGWIKFCENELTLTNGDPLFLLDSFKVWGEQVWGWYYFIDQDVYIKNKRSRGGHFERKRIRKRLINKQYLIVARGAAKTLYGASHQIYELTVDRETTHQITCSPTMRQSEEMLNPIKTAITKARGPYFKFLTEGSLQNTTGAKINRQKLTPTKKGIENFLTGSILQIVPMAIDKIQGLQPKISTVDEWLSGDVKEDVIGAIEQGGTKLDDYLIIAMSSEGTVRNGVGDSIKLELMSILKGEYDAPNVSIFWYKLDDVSEVGFPELWEKANPNIGKTVKYDAYYRDVARAEKNPVARNDILAKRFGIPTEGYTYFFTYEETIPKLKKRNYWEMRCSLGVDLSQGDDFCAFTFLFPLPRERFGIKTRSYITENTFHNLPSAMRQKYESFIKEGTLIIMPGTILNMMDVYEDIIDHIDHSRYDVCCMGYDPYGAKDFVERWSNERGSYGVEKVIQGMRTESVPLGELKKLSEKGCLLFDEELMSFSMGNAMVMEDTNGNRKLYKRRRSQKIDNVSALMDAFVAYKLHLDDYL